MRRAFQWTAQRAHYVMRAEFTAGESVDVVDFFFSSRRRHTRLQGDWSSDVCSSDLQGGPPLSQRSVADARSMLAGIQAGTVEIGRASCGKECRSRWSPYH